MDPSRNNYPPNGSNNGHGRPQQMPGFPYQFQNPQLANLSGLPQRGLNMHGMMQHQLGQRSQQGHQYGDHRDLIAALARQTQGSSSNNFPPHQHQNPMNFRRQQQQQHHHQQQRQQHHPHQQQQQHQGSMFFSGDQFHRHAAAQQAQSHNQQSNSRSHRSPFAMLQEEHERQKQQELQDAQARQFHEFLFSRQNGGPGSDAVASPTQADRQRSSSFISHTKTDEPHLSPHLRTKRGYSNISDDVQYHEDDRDVAKRSEANGFPIDEESQIDPSMNGQHIPDNESLIQENPVVDLTTDEEIKNGVGPGPERRDSDNGVEFVGMGAHTSMNGNVIAKNNIELDHNVAEHEIENGTYYEQNESRKPGNVGKSYDAGEPRQSIDITETIDNSNQAGLIEINSGRDSQPREHLLTPQFDTQPRELFKDADNFGRRDGAFESRELEQRDSIEGLESKFRKFVDAENALTKLDNVVELRKDEEIISVDSDDSSEPCDVADAKHVDNSAIAGTSVHTENPTISDDPFISEQSNSVHHENNVLQRSQMEIGDDDDDDDEVEIISNEERGGEHLSMLLEAVKNSSTPLANSTNSEMRGIDMLAEVTGEDNLLSNESDHESMTYPDSNGTKLFNAIKDISDTNAAKLFASMKQIPVNANEIDTPVVENNDEKKIVSPHLPLKDPEPKDPVEAMLWRLPELPSEPDYNLDGTSVRHGNGAQDAKRVPLDVKEPVFITKEEEEFEEPLYYQSIDPWFPSNNAVKRERRKLKHDATAYEMKLSDGKQINVTNTMHNRLGKSSEPGVIDKLPHCKIHSKMFQAQYGKLSREPLFCCQVTEIYCNSVMLCCSICSTWRHAECGGHYKHYSPLNREENFVPICDRCHKEKQLIQKYPQAEKRIARQRSIHLRKNHVAADIMRHAAYAKHGGTYKWPLGSVLQSQIGGHSRSVHIRHERSEKQWKEMLHRLNSAAAGKKDLKQRTKELERVLNNLEEAEGKTDRHNMILFLQRDSKQRYPTGFEDPQLNFFDPEEDHVRLACLKDKANNTDLTQLEIEEDSSSSDSEDSTSSQETPTCKRRKIDVETEMPVSIPSPTETFQTVLGRAKAIAAKPKKKAAKYCIRVDCKRKPRFDSSFCSDACGVSVMENDLLQTLTFANNMHPYNLRT